MDLFLGTVKNLFNIRKSYASIPLTTPKLKLAFLISRIFGPVPLLCLLWLITALKSGIGVWRALWIYPLILLLALIIPTLVTSLFIAQKKSDIEWKDITQRKKYLLPVLVSSVIVLETLTFFLTNPTVFHLSLLFSAIILSMNAIWVLFNFKISGHMVVATMTIAGIILFFGFKFIWLGLLLLPILWARHTLKVHTYPELTAGVLLPLSLSIAAILIFGWPQIG